MILYRMLKLVDCICINIVVIKIVEILLYERKLHLKNRGQNFLKLGAIETLIGKSCSSFEPSTPVCKSIFGFYFFLLILGPTEAYMCYEVAHKGNLLSFVRESCDKLSSIQLVHLLRGISCGMQYLSDLGYCHKVRKRS